MTVTLAEAPDVERWSTRLAERLCSLRLLPRGGEPREARIRADVVVRDLLPRSRVLVVSVDGRRVGHVWLTRDGQSLDVADLRLDDVALGARVREAVLEIAATDGATELGVGVVPRQPDQQAFVDGGGFVLTATNMLLDLAGPATGDSHATRLDAMTPEEFSPFMADQESTYARERQDAGESPERASRTAHEQLAQLVPDGLASPGQHFLVGRVGGVAVGNLWLAVEPPTVYVYDVVVAPEHRSRGHGRALMVAAERWARRREAAAVRLNVFGHNVVARSLYDSLGFVVLEDHYLRRLGDR